MINLNKYLKVMYGTKSGASNFEYKLDQINIAKTWSPNELAPLKKWVALILVQKPKY